MFGNPYDLDGFSLLDSLLQCGNHMMEAVRSPKIEFILAQHPWLENDCLYSDIILPANTKLEEEDIGADILSEQFRLIITTNLDFARWKGVFRMRL